MSWINLFKSALDENSYCAPQNKNPDSRMYPFEHFSFKIGAELQKPLLFFQTQNSPPQRIRLDSTVKKPNPALQDFLSSAKAARAKPQKKKPVSIRNHKPEAEPTSPKSPKPQSPNTSPNPCPPSPYAKTPPQAQPFNQ